MTAQLFNGKVTLVMMQGQAIRTDDYPNYQAADALVGAVALFFATCVFGFFVLISVIKLR